MPLDPSRWRSASEYDYVESLTAPDLAWEWLRRNTDYQHEYARAIERKEDPRDLTHLLRRSWGCDFPIDPQRTALQAVVYWQPEIDPGTVILSTRSPIPDLQPVDFPLAEPDTTMRDPDGTSLTVSDHLGALRILFIDEAGPDTPLVAVIPLDNAGLDRIEAALRLWRILQGRPSASNGRLTAQRRQRLRRMLQAIDGYIDGASYRDIGKVLYGKSRIAAEVWKTSALRDSTISLVRDGRAMINGGYRSLLRQRRRK